LHGKTRTSGRRPPGETWERTIAKPPGGGRRSKAPAATTAPSPSTRRLPLGSLRVFVAVAHHLSFTRAADALGVSASAASLQIRSLEEYLRRPLFRRSGHQVNLTTEGEQLLPRVRKALSDLEHAIDDTREDRTGGALRITTLNSFLQQWLLPRLQRFHMRHPAIDLHVHTSAAAVDFVREELHAGIRVGLGDWPNLHVEKLLDEWLVPVCSPDLLKKHGPVHDMNDLKRYRLLHSTTEPWTGWMLGGLDDEDERSAVTGLRFDDSVAVVRSAANGLGLALARWSLVSSEIAAGTLVQASPTPVKFRRSYWFVCPPRSLQRDTVAQFREWLFAEAREFCDPPGVGQAG